MDMRFLFPRFPFMCWVAHRPRWVGVLVVLEGAASLFSSNVTDDSMAMVASYPESLRVVGRAEPGFLHVAFSVDEGGNGSSSAAKRINPVTSRNHS